jgi:alginate O-acetyltransferase complex protein AlgI
MLFSSPDFLFGFLPVFLAVYFISPMRLKNLVLMLASLFFYFTTSGQLTVILILSIVVNHLIAQRMHAAGAGAAKAWLGLGLALNLAPLLYYKYARFFLSSLQAAADAAGLHLPMPDLHPILPIGISFFTFQAISYIADVYMRRVAPARSLVDFGMYHACFPQLIAGPIVRYEEIEKQVHSRTHTLDDVYNGSVQFCFGLAKKVALADPAGIVADKAFGLPHDQLTLGSAWLGIAAYTFQIYFDFSGYSDMAIGLGRILGFPYPENFDQPYRARSITEFWRRWHMTLSRWFRDYVYIPLGGNRAALPRTLLNLALVFFLCGLWHGAAYTFVVWGLYHGALLVAERLLRGWTTLRLPAVLGWVYTLAAVMIGWVLFRADTLQAAVHYIGTMLTPGPLALAPAMGAIVTDDKLAFLALGAAVALIPYRPLLDFAGRRYHFGPGAAVTGLALACLAFVMLSVNSFTPFIYFRF